MNTKRKGTRNEHRSMALLELSGYACTRAAASLGAFDIIAVGPNDVLLVQVKSNRKPERKEMETKKQFVAAPACRKVIHVWKDRVKDPVIINVTNEEL